MLIKEEAERLGFEPKIQLPVCHFSKVVLSTAQPSLRLNYRDKGTENPQCDASLLTKKFNKKFQTPSFGRITLCMRLIISYIQRGFTHF